MTRAQQTIIHAIMSSFDDCTLDEDFVIQISVDTKSGPFLFTVEEASICITNQQNNVSRSYKFIAFLQYLKGFTEPFGTKAHKHKPTRGVDMTALEVNLTHNEELFLGEVALVARTAKVELINGSDAISFNDCQVRGLLTTLTSKRVFSKCPSEEGMQYHLTSTGYRVLGYDSPVPPLRVIKRPIDGKPTKSIAEEFSGTGKIQPKSGNSNPRTEYSKGEQPSDSNYEEVMVDLRGKEHKKQPLCRKLILSGFDNDSVSKAMKELMSLEYASAEVNKQRRSLKRKGLLSN